MYTSLILKGQAQEKMFCYKTCKHSILFHKSQVENISMCPLKLNLKPKEENIKSFSMNFHMESK